MLFLTGAGGSKLSLLGFVEITCSIGKFTLTEEFAVIDGIVSDMLLGITSFITLPSGVVACLVVVASIITSIITSSSRVVLSPVDFLYAFFCFY